jgi:Repeat of unknown function (DUF5648)
MPRRADRRAARRFGLLLALFAALASDGVLAFGVVLVYEFYNATHDRYFRTANRDEAMLLVREPSRGWVRTGRDFGAIDAAASDGAGAPVCRFFASAYTSHFYTADAAECDYVQARWPEVWAFEAIDFYIHTPLNGSCASTNPYAPPVKPNPIYRVFNGRFDPNHRYLSSAIDYDEMLARGWIGEGVAMCGLGGSASALEQLVDLKGSWQFDRPVVFPGVGRVYVEERNVYEFRLGGQYSLVDKPEPMALVVTYSAGRFLASGETNCQAVLFYRLCDFHEFEFAFDGGPDRVVGTHTVIHAQIGGPDVESNEFIGVRQ